MRSYPDALRRRERFEAAPRLPKGCWRAPPHLPAIRSAGSPPRDRVLCRGHGTIRRCAFQCRRESVVLHGRADSFRTLARRRPLTTTLWEVQAGGRTCDGGDASPLCAAEAPHQRGQERGCACHGAKVPLLFVLGRSRTESQAARRIRNLEAREGARPYANPTRAREVITPPAGLQATADGRGITLRWTFTSRCRSGLRRTGGAPARRVTSTRRTARCGPACRVVWQGSWRLLLHAPTPILTQRSKPMPHYSLTSSAQASRAAT
jgi:hypothetical protein